ncbi:MAG TPA: CopD family protein [Anaerolineales bacterium]|jgi:copper transport protein|nr:CopD family protein [Anaerolineales bacterium]
MKRFIPPLLIVVLISLGIASPVKAHASLVRSVPQSGEVLTESPPEIVLEFTEEIDPGVAKVELFDAGGQLIAAGPGVVDPNAPRVLQLEVDPLPDGAYSAVWRVRSAVDGHITNGAVGFSIGEASAPASLLPPPGTPDPAAAVPSNAETIARWLAYLSAAVAVGSLSFGFLIWRPAYQNQTDKSEEFEEAVRRRMGQLALGSLILLGIATFSFALIQTAEALEVPVWGLSGTALSQMFLGYIGRLLMARLILVILLGVLVARLPSPGTGSKIVWWSILLIGSALLLTFSLQGHSAARGSVIGVVMIWLHLAGMTVWLGGLPMLFFVLRQANAMAPTIFPRFSQAALISVGMIAATGLYNGLIFVRTGEALTATTYGRALIAKTGIFAFLLMLGAINLLYLSPRLRAGVQGAWYGLSRTIRTEMALGIALLLAVGVLSGVAPAFEALQAHQQQGIIETASVDGVDMMLRVMPGESGDNEIGVEFTDTRPGAANVPPEVLLRLTATSMDMGTQQVEATSVDGVRYTVRGSYFPMVGPWELEIIIRRPGFNDVRKTFALNISSP